MFKKRKNPLLFLLALVVFGQIIFAIASESYTTPYYENRIFATTGIKFDGNDLHKLNEGAHYFGQTMIGWTKFPNFKHALVSDVDLPVDTEINMHMQERQNIIFSLITKEPIDFDQLEGAKGYLQAKIDEYNTNANTQFILTNVDYEQAEISRSYGFGAMTTLLLSIILGLAILFTRKEFFPPKLKL
ncbi:hypothetical protein ACFL6I_05780 [candidate division KSB1 bacterium]